jgi:hypothetical protein
MRKAWERWSGILSLAQPAVGFFGGVRGCAWGLWALTHPDLFERYSTFFRPMQSVAAPWVWGVGVASLGCVQLLAQGFGIRPLRRTCALLACMGWTGLAYTYWRGDPGSLGIPLLLCDAVAAGWAYLRLSDDYRDGRAP